MIRDIAVLLTATNRLSTTQTVYDPNNFLSALTAPEPTRPHFIRNVYKTNVVQFAVLTAQANRERARSGPTVRNSEMNFMDAKTIAIHIFVEISKTDQRKLVFHRELVTGLQIKDAAQVPADSDLALREHGQLVLVVNDETITIKEGEHFVSLPAGTIS